MLQILEIATNGDLRDTQKVGERGNANRTPVPDDVEDHAMPFRR